MPSYELLEHTADLAVVARGRDLAQALEWLAIGMFSVLADLDAVFPRESIDVEVSSSDRESLAVDWLNELLFRYEAEGFLPRKFSVAVDESGTSLQARCTGEPADAERHSTRPAVKAATYHALEVTHNGEWRVHVVVDI